MSKQIKKCAFYDYMLCKTFLHTLVFEDASSPLFLAYCRIDIFRVLRQFFCRKFQIVCGFWNPANPAFRMYGHFLFNDPSNQLGAGPFQICPLTSHQCETWLDPQKHNEKDRDKEMLRTPSKRDSRDLWPLSLRHLISVMGKQKLRDTPPHWVCKSVTQLVRKMLTIFILGPYVAFWCYWLKQVLYVPHAIKGLWKPVHNTKISRCNMT